jgi:hypothetical protein
MVAAPDGKRIGMRALVALLALVCLPLSAGSSAAHSPWPDPRHGWDFRCDRDGTCSLYATEDGGRHWHRIFNGETDDVMGFLRTSAAGGVISINLKAPEQYWTRDNGRHWYFTRRLPPFWQGGISLAGRGHLLFWSRSSSLYRVSNWLPSRRTALRFQRVAAVRDGTFEDLAWIPRGVVGVVLRDRGASNVPVVRALLRRGPRNVLVRLRDPDPSTALRIDSLTIFASWPELMVLAEDDHGNPLYSWRSSDGGRTWATPVR